MIYQMTWPTDNIMHRRRPIVKEVLTQNLIDFDARAHGRNVFILYTNYCIISTLSCCLISLYYVNLKNVSRRVKFCIRLFTSGKRFVFSRPQFGSWRCMPTQSYRLLMRVGSHFIKKLLNSSSSQLSTMT